MISANCFCCVTGPINSDVILKTGKTGVKYCQVSINVNYFNNNKSGDKYSQQLYQFALFNESAERFCEKCNRGDIVSVIGLPLPGKSFTTNKGDTFTPVEIKNASWKGYTIGNGSEEGSDTDESEF